MAGLTAAQAEMVDHMCPRAQEVLLGTLLQTGTFGDITSVTAGTGLSGGGSAGDLTINIDTTWAGTLASLTLSSGPLTVGTGGATLTETTNTLTIEEATIVLDAATSIKLNGTVTFDDDGTLADAANVMTITQNTITLAGGTKINLDGPVDISGAVVIDTATTTGLSITAASLTDAIKISATTPVDGFEISSACSGSAINLSGSSATQISIAKGYTSYGINFAKGANKPPIIIGTKSNTADDGLILVGATDNTGGVQIFCDDGGDTLGSVTSPIWSRYLITANQGSGGPTATGAYLQSKSLTGLTFTTGCYSACKTYYQIGGTLALATSAELAVISAAFTLEGAVTVGSGCRMSGIDVNISNGGTGGNTITDTADDTAGIHIRKVAVSTIGWPKAIYIHSGGSTAGLVIGAKSSSATLGHHIGVANSADTAGDKAVAVFCDDNNATLASDAQGINSRCLILHAQAGGYAMTALRGHLRGVANVTPNAQKSFASVDGYTEFSGTYTISDGSNAVFLCGMTTTVELGGTPTIAAQSRICGLLVTGNFASAIAGSTAPSVGVMYQAGALGYGYQFALGFHDGVSGMLSTGTDSANVTHKVAVWINGVGTRYLHVFSD